MTFWIATINPYKYAKFQLPHEIIAFKTLAQIWKKPFWLLRPLGVKVLKWMKCILLTNAFCSYPNCIFFIYSRDQRLQSSVEQHSFLHPQIGWIIQNMDDFFHFSSNIVNVPQKRAILFQEFIANEGFHSLKKDDFYAWKKNVSLYGDKWP
jgi:hypothetical protein